MNAHFSRIASGNASLATIFDKGHPDTRESLRGTLTISIVSHGHGPLLQNLLRDLNSLSELNGVTVVVTLNLQSEDFDEHPFKELQLVVVRNETPKGFAENHNCAFKNCSTAWFAILNPDLHLRENLFSSFLANAGSNARIGLVAPRIINSQGQLEDSVRANLTPLAVLRRGVLGHGPEVIPEHRFRWYAGMFLLLRSSAFAAVNGFDGRFFLYCEDYDLCARLHLKSFGIVQDPSVSVVHDARRHSRIHFRYFWLHVRSLVRVWTSLSVWRIAVQDCIAGWRRASNS
jgi:GT2 family glycosyltransferase